MARGASAARSGAERRLGDRRRAGVRGEVRLAREVEVGGEIGEAGALVGPTTIGPGAGRTDEVLYLARPGIELVVADDRRLDPDRVQDADVGAADALLEEGVEGGVAAGVEERAGDVVVARRQRDRIGLQVLQPVDDRGEARRIVNRREPGFEVGGVQDLQPEYRLLDEVEPDQQWVVIGDARQRSRRRRSPGRGRSRGCSRARRLRRN